VLIDEIVVGEVLNLSAISINDKSDVFNKFIISNNY